MPTAAIVTLIGVGILILALAFYLIRIALILRSVIKTLGLITFGVRSIAHQTEPVNQIVGEIRDDVRAMEGALKDLLEAKKSRAPTEVA